MSARVMRYTVVRRHPDTDIPTALVAGKPVPDWAKDLVQAEDLVAANGEAVQETPATPEPAATPVVPATPPAAPVEPADPAAGTDDDGTDDGADGSGNDNHGAGAPPAAPTPDYSALKKGELQAEVEKRNQGREDDDLIVVEGKGHVADLVAALQADDVAQSDTGN
ncbi:hypothetical protein EFK50_01065 [Nocardioides marmoriginsengisoli]|uniref:Uncharacterized protein n=1 Tax=Nocardioides marmoriginsengisoli TaxID=661483 RepID=A0A3N0CS13_9ACTN|nr:hypothetical protein [Nocardioides marmoriginsengisoli]RNL66247.1 hypothetical protein EFK50_01065 [Nocardioides marmoriginsengisoli]